MCRRSSGLSSRCTTEQARKSSEVGVSLGWGRENMSSNTEETRVIMDFRIRNRWPSQVLKIASAPVSELKGAETENGFSCAESTTVEGEFIVRV